MPSRHGSHSRHAHASRGVGSHGSGARDPGGGRGSACRERDHLTELNVLERQASDARSYTPKSNTRNRNFSIICARNDAARFLVFDFAV
eukprot:1270531-Rhodomonas_salina.1